MTPGEAAYRKRREIHGFALSWEALSDKTKREWEEIAAAAIEAAGKV